MFYISYILHITVTLCVSCEVTIMLEKFKANLMFQLLLKRKDINKAYKMVGPEDSWYDTITKVHQSLAEIRQLPHEDWELESFDGLKLKGVFYPGTSNKTMIWVHGYTSHAERESAFPGLFYHSLGFNVLIPYLRSHGPSEGKYISFGALEYRDMMDWVEKVNARIPNGQIILHGLSMGGGIILALATREMPNVKCLISDAPTIGIPQAFRGIVSGTFKKDADKIYEHLMNRFRREFSVDINEFDWAEKISTSRYPLLLSAGSNENMEESLNQLKAAAQETSVLILPGCNHGNGMYKQTELYQNTIKKFIAKHMA